MAAKSTASVIEILPLDVGTLMLEIIGDSPLITHAWSEKAKGQMRDKQQGRAQNRKEPKNPQAEFEAAFHRLPDGRPGFPALGFKAAAVAAARQLDGVQMTFLRGAFHVPGDLVPIEAGNVTMREDTVRVGMGVADLRYRPEFWPWSTVLPIRYNRRALTVERIVHLFNQGGFSVGVGEWRPERDGNFGMFHVQTVEEVAG